MRASFTIGSLALVAAFALGGCPAPAPTWSTPVAKQDRMLLSVWGTGPDDLWFVGGTASPGACTVSNARPMILHFDGATWTEVPTTAQAVLWWVFGFARDDVWFAGSGGTVLHWDGKTVSAVNAGATAMDTFYGLWGPAPGELWAVGGCANNFTTVMRLHQGSWTKDASAPPAAGGAYFKVWGASASDVWFVGESATLVNFDGAAYHQADPGSSVGPRDRITTVAGRAANDVYAVGGLASPIAIHFDGHAWGPVPGLDLSNASALTGVFEDAAGDVAITGLGGVKITGRPNAWRDDSLIPPGADFHAVWLDGPDDVFAAGGDFFQLNGGTVGHYGQPVPAK
jgi:hypothetical protein